MRSVPRNSLLAAKRIISQSVFPIIPPGGHISMKTMRLFSQLEAGEGFPRAAGRVIIDMKLLDGAANGI